MRTPCARTDPWACDAARVRGRAPSAARRRGPAQAAACAAPRAARPSAFASGSASRESCRSRGSKDRPCRGTGARGLQPRRDRGADARASPSSAWAAAAAPVPDRVLPRRGACVRIFPVDFSAITFEGIVMAAIGFIGLGAMGRHMAASLQRAGHELRVHDLKREAAAEHLAAGAHWAESATAAAQGVDVLFTSLPGPPDVEAIAATLRDVLRPGTAWFDLTTNSPDVVRK